MPRFFFNLRNEILVEDNEGKELENTARARETAVTYARCIMAEDVKDGRLILKDEIDILDSDREKVLTLPFRDAIRIEE